ncbi:MAG: chromosome segregation protein [Verrucomicrobiales bacterium]|nr:chromosome segregation protein [Verrucomicrobiales bacterium]
MYLKNLTVLGFKSFADKTSLNFQPGVTAIVGPNGCGKSNVSDAIRWVLGEQSAKALRGGEMADVIFNGTDTRKPLGMAEVSLTISGVDAEHLQAAGVEVTYDEVTLTRRVFRDGGSEYFINKTACRLRDVQQLFMGTGVGRTSYSIMAQGNITQILSSKPDDRRLVFEEAAGITKFKAQKKESLRKLEQTDQNLLRIDDLIKEVKRQIGSLQRQAGKARRYKQFISDLQHLETQLARHQFDVLQVEIGERQEKVEKLRVEFEVCSESTLRIENEIAQLRERLTELEQEISLSQQHGLELKNNIDRNESRIHFNEERLREFESQNARAMSEITQAEERRLAAEQELASVVERLQVSTSNLEQQRLTLDERRESLSAVEGELREKQEVLRKAQSDQFAAAQQLSRVRNQINSLDIQKQGNTVRLEKLSAEKVQLEEERNRLEMRLQEFTMHAEAERVSVLSSRGTVEERQQRLKALQQEINAITYELDQVTRQSAEKRSRLHVLEQLEDSHEGFSSGALSALKTATNVLGSLADKIRVPDQHVIAIEAALGHNLQLVLTEQPETANEILLDLSVNKKGRASIASLQLRSMAQESAPELGGVVSGTPALSVIEADESIQFLLKSLLGKTWIVADLAAATQGFKDSNGLLDFVTTGGDLLNRHGVFTGGSSNANKGAASILGRKNQIVELQAGVGQLQDQMNEISRNKGALVSEQTALQASLQEAQSELRTQEVAIATRQGEFNALQNSQRVLLQKIGNVGHELETLSGHEQEGIQKREALAAQIGEFEFSETRIQQQVAELSAGLEGLRQQRDAANSAVTEMKVAVATEEQLLASFRNQQRPLETRIRELGNIADQRRNEIGSFLARKSQAENEINEAQQKIASLQSERDQVNAQTAEWLGSKSTQEREIAGKEEDLRGQRRRHQEVQQVRGSIEVELAQKQMAVQNLRERISQKYQVNLDEVQSECITITIADEGPPKVTTLTPEEMADSGAATDWEVIAAQVSVLQKRLDEIGPVNLVAIEEYEETEQRYQFLTTQNDDLIKAKEQLMEVINKINSQTKEMFTEAFTKIRDNFRAMFTEIFGGGKADLILTDTEDVLESGIDIVARPPGKQLQSITLLSGGEQTMTAVALLFSIYQVKPSPFCVLDELDAPLDESNINRFIRVLQRFLVHSQFIIITHNKRTIGIADVLYGVTMQEHGVSRIVGVKFHKSDGQVEDQNSKLLVPQAAGESLASEEDKLQSREETIDVVMAK